tara:strand:+ start:103 stop:1116 length:1014 start_codon:yes stop_codon:yes gene_type:complete
LTLFKIFFSTTFSYAESFDIKNIEISRQFNMNFQKIDVLDEGFKIAYHDLIKNITKSKDQFKLKDLSLFDIKTMIDNFSIKEEKFIDDIYYVSLDVSFNKKKIFSFLEKKNVFPSQPKKKKVFFLPVVVEEKEKNIFLFSENNFYKNWLVNNNNQDQITYVLPLDDLDDIRIIESKYESLEDYDFKEIINKYFLEDYIISLIYKNNSDLRILSKIKLSNKIILDSREFKNFTDESLLNTIEQLKVIYEDYWKKENQINTSIKLPLTIAINILDDKKIGDFEKIIKKFDMVSSFHVSKIDNVNIYYKVIFNGTPQAFILGMQKSGYNLDIKKKIWELE